MREKVIALGKERFKTIKYFFKKHYSHEMMVNKGYVDISVSTIYYWIHRGYLGKQRDCLIYPRKPKANRPVRSEKFGGFGKSIDERPEYINKRTEIGHFEIDAVVLSRHLPKGTKNTTSAEVARIELWINRYPKRLFNYLTPEMIYRSG